MKKVLILIPLFCFCQSCSRTLLLSDRTFIHDDPYKVTSIKFVNDTICTYEQQFLCDLDEQYRKTRITCTYKVMDKKIILKNTTKYADSLNIQCFKLPESQIRKCSFMNKELMENKPLVLGDQGNLSIIDMYGYIDNITTDTLTYKKKTILHKKWNSCYPFLMFVSTPFREKK